MSEWVNKVNERMNEWGNYGAMRGKRRMSEWGEE